jgi:Flp pilus assembly protein TadG
MPCILQAGLGRSNRRRSSRGVAGLEFALLAPLLITMLAGLYDLTTAYIAWERLKLCVQAIDQIATIQAANSATPNTLTRTQTTTAASSIYAYLPSILTASAPPFGVTVSSVVMTPTVSGCTSGCTYKAHVAWSGTYQGTAGSRRPCDTVQGTSVITQTTDTAPPASTTLPGDVYSAAPLLVVDATYTFTPFFYSFISSFTMKQSAYFAPRTGISNNWIQYIYAAPDSTTLCAGYPSA